MPPAVRVCGVCKGARAPGQSVGSRDARQQSPLYGRPRGPRARWVGRISLAGRARSRQGSVSCARAVDGTSTLPPTEPCMLRTILLLDEAGGAALRDCDARGRVDRSFNAGRIFSHTYARALRGQQVTPLPRPVAENRALSDPYRNWRAPKPISPVRSALHLRWATCAHG
jgi:hypothetical protein